MAIDAREEADPLGRAMYDHARGRPGTLSYRDGAETRDGHVEEYYFSPPETWAEETIELLERLAALDGPVLDVGCGAGQHVLWLQERGVDVVGVDASPNAVAAARERGARDARVGDMFDLPFDGGRFRGLHVVGTQIGLAGSLAGVAELLAEFARVTDDEGVAVVHNYDPRAVGEDLFGYRPDPRDGIARRCFHFEYDPDGGEAGGPEADGDPVDDRGRNREVGPTLSFLLFSPDRLADATIGTPWTVADVLATGSTYKAVLSKGDD